MRIPKDIRAQNIEIAAQILLDALDSPFARQRLAELPPRTSAKLRRAMEGLALALTLDYHKRPDK